MILPPPFIESQMNSLAKNNVEVDSYKIYGNGFFGYLKNLFPLRKQIINNNYDIIHSHYSLSCLLVLLTFVNKPIIVSFMGSDLYGKIDKYGRRKMFGIVNYLISKFIQLFVKKIIVKSQNLADYIYLKKKMEIIPNGVDFQIFKPLSKKISRNKLKLSLTKKYILFIGNKENDRKNFTLLKNCLKDFEKDNIYLIPNKYPISVDEVVTNLNATDTLVLTSFYEGSPNIIKEAMACNCPIVSVDVGDVKDNIINTNGCYLSGYNKFDLIKKIKLSIAFNKRTNGRKNISHLEINKVAKKIISIYEDVLNKKNN